MLAGPVDIRGRIARRWGRFVQPLCSAATIGQVFSASGTTLDMAPIRGRGEEKGQTPNSVSQPLSSASARVTKKRDGTKEALIDTSLRG